MVPLVAVALLFAAVGALGLVRVAAAVLEREAAQSAADAAALAAVTGGESAAREVAVANDATVVEYREVDEVVTVVVRRGRSTARASASWRPLMNSPGRDSPPRAVRRCPSRRLPRCLVIGPATPVQTSPPGPTTFRPKKSSHRGVRSGRHVHGAVSRLGLIPTGRLTHTITVRPTRSRRRPVSWPRRRR
ncbi:MAG: hypothetical protein KDB02_14080 [Acidimicrobiales bacterium]|nr:hypothetical protein [Acidimicrobiales bacterium]